MFNKILVVCIGNICRSPTGEALLRARLPEKQIGSAGLRALVDHGADAQASAEAAQHGLDLSAHRARQLTRQLCQSHDLILVMEQEHIGMVAKIDPSARGKTMLFGHWINNKEVADPFRRSDEVFALVYAQMDEAARAWQNKLK